MKLYTNAIKYTLSTILLTNTVNVFATTADNSKYYAVFDAGSSGTRVYLYQTTNNQPKLLFTAKNNIQLDSDVNNPESAVNNNIGQLLNALKPTIQQYKINHADIEVDILATAGMRYVAQDAQDKYYQNITQILREQNYYVHEARTITGREEGVFAWIDANYLSKTLGTNNTVGTIEIGGASAQIVYVTKDKSSTSSNISTVKLNDKTYNLYAYSYLGLGKNRAYKEMLEQNKESDICLKGQSSYVACQDGFKALIAQYNKQENVTKYSNYDSTNFIGIDYIYKIRNAIDDNFNVINYCATNTDLECANANYLRVLFKDYLKPKHFTPVHDIEGSEVSFTEGYVYMRVNNGEI